MTNINALYPSKYLKAADLKRPDGSNASMTLTIERVVIEQIMEDKPDTKPCLYFVGKTKGIVLNKTNGLMIAHSYGDEIEAWTNRPVQLYIEAVSFRGDIVDSIRVRVPVQQQVVQQSAQVVRQPEQVQQTTALVVDDKQYAQEQRATDNATDPAIDDFVDDDIPF